MDGSDQDRTKSFTKQRIAKQNPISMKQIKLNSILNINLIQIMKNEDKVVVPHEVGINVVK